MAEGGLKVPRKQVVRKLEVWPLQELLALLLPSLFLSSPDFSLVGLSGGSVSSHSLPYTVSILLSCPLLSHRPISLSLHSPAAEGH